MGKRLSTLSREINYEIGLLIDECGPNYSCPSKINESRGKYLYSRSIKGKQIVK